MTQYTCAWCSQVVDAEKEKYGLVIVGTRAHRVIRAGGRPGPHVADTLPDDDGEQLDTLSDEAVS